MNELNENTPNETRQNGDIDRCKKTFMNGIDVLSSRKRFSDDAILSGLMLAVADFGLQVMKSGKDGGVKEFMQASLGKACDLLQPKQEVKVTTEKRFADDHSLTR